MPRILRMENLDLKQRYRLASRKLPKLKVVEVRYDFVFDKILVYYSIPKYGTW